MNNPQSSDSCHSLQVNVQTPDEKNKFEFSRILQMTYRHTLKKKLKIKKEKKKEKKAPKGFVLEL